MNKYYTGLNGYVSYDNIRLYDVSNWSIEAEYEIYASTTLGDAASTFRYGRPSYAGTLNILANEEPGSDIKVVTEEIFRTLISPKPQLHTLSLVQKSNNLFSTIRCSVVFTNASYEVTPGEAVSIELAFNVTGLFTEYGWNESQAIIINTANIAITRNDIDLRYRALALTTRAFTATLNPILLLAEEVIFDVGAFVLNAPDIQLIPSFLAVPTGEYLVAFNAQDLLLGRELSVDALAFTLGLEDQTFEKQWALSVDTGVFTVAALNIALDPGPLEILLYTGNGSTQSITGLGFEPSIVWTKRRSGAVGEHVVYDSVRGTTKYWRPSATGAEVTSATTLTSFDSDGFTLGSSTLSNVNTAPYVAWCWTDLGSAASNTDGTITTSVAASASLKMSIFTYTGNGSTGATIGHGLGEEPDFVIIKCLSNSSTAAVVGSPLLASNNFLNLFANNASTSNSAIYQGYSSTTITLGTSSNVNLNAGRFIGYAFASVTGKSKIATYSGTGATDNSVTTGFNPSFVLIKSLSSGDWMYFDGARGVTEQIIHTTAVATTVDKVTFDANGFTVKANENTNTNAQTFLYMAFR